MKCKFCKFLLKFCGIFVALNVGLFLIFFYDLDGKLLFNVVEPPQNEGRPAPLWH